MHIMDDKMMRSLSRSFLLLALAALSAAGPALAARGVRPENPKVDPQLCRIDEAPQAAGLAVLRTEIARRLEREGHALSAESLLSLAAELGAHFSSVARQGLVAECQRPLNLILNDISDGIELMKVARRVEARRLGLSKVVQALNFYGHQFQPRGWQWLDYQP